MLSIVVEDGGAIKVINEATAAEALTKAITAVSSIGESLAKVADSSDAWLEMAAVMNHYGSTLTDFNKAGAALIDYYRKAQAAQPKTESVHRINESFVDSIKAMADKAKTVASQVKDKLAVAKRCKLVANVLASGQLQNAISVAVDALSKLDQATPGVGQLFEVLSKMKTPAKTVDIYNIVMQEQRSAAQPTPTAEQQVNNAVANLVPGGQDAIKHVAKILAAATKKPITIQQRDAIIAKLNGLIELLQQQAEQPQNVTLTGDQLNNAPDELDSAFNKHYG
jgi:hypothetical protein